MNELIIEENGQYLISSFAFLKKYKDSIEYEHLKHLSKKTYLDFLDVVELAMELSYKNPDELKRNLELVDLSEAMMADRNKMFTASSLRIMVSKNFLDSRPTEFSIHELFRENYQNILTNGEKIVKRKNDPKHIPDFWIKKDEEFIPVEIKLRSFTDSSFNQLKRYMDFYGCKQGIAVANELNCDLPKNIKFINYKELECAK